MGEAGPVQVRRVRTTDWQESKRLRLAALKTDRLAFGSTLEGELAFPEELWERRARDGAESAENATWLAILPDGSAVGTIVFRFDEGEGHLFGMWVDPAHRGRGVGGRLLDTALDWARTVRPGEPVHLDVNPHQEAAVRLYESRGFKFTGGSEPLGHTEGEVILRMTRAP